MRKVFFCFALLFSIQAYSQKLTKQLTDSICTCFEESILEAKPVNYRDSLNACISQYMAQHSYDLFEEYSLEGFTVENVHFIQAKILARLEKKCKLLKSLED